MKSLSVGNIPESGISGLSLRDILFFQDFYKLLPKSHQLSLQLVKYSNACIPTPSPARATRLTTASV